MCINQKLSITGSSVRLFQDAGLSVCFHGKHSWGKLNNNQLALVRHTQWSQCSSNSSCSRVHRLPSLLPTFCTSNSEMTTFQLLSHACSLQSGRIDFTIYLCNAIAKLLPDIASPSGFPRTVGIIQRTTQTAQVPTESKMSRMIYVLNWQTPACSIGSAACHTAISVLFGRRSTSGKHTVESTCDSMQVALDLMGLPKCKNYASEACTKPVHVHSLCLQSGGSAWCI